MTLIAPPSPVLALSKAWNRDTHAHTEQMAHRDAHTHTQRRWLTETHTHTHRGDGSHAETHKTGADEAELPALADLQALPEVIAVGDERPDVDLA